MTSQIITSPIKKQDLKNLAAKQFGDLVKVVVDIKKEILAVGGELHADEEALLIQDGSQQEDLWGINLYPDQPAEEWLEFDSMINVRPSLGNRSRGVESIETQNKIKSIIQKFIL